MIFYMYWFFSVYFVLDICLQFLEKFLHELYSTPSANIITLYFLITHILYHERYSIYKKLLSNKQSQFIFFNGITAWKVSVFGVILVHIFPHSHWIQRDPLRIQSECRKIRTRKTLHMDTFYAVNMPSALHMKTPKFHLISWCGNFVESHSLDVGVKHLSKYVKMLALHETVPWFYNERNIVLNALAKILFIWTGGSDFGWIFFWLWDPIDVINFVQNIKRAKNYYLF